MLFVDRIQTYTADLLFEDVSMTSCDIIISFPAISTSSTTCASTSSGKEATMRRLTRSSQREHWRHQPVESLIGMGMIDETYVEEVRFIGHASYAVPENAVSAATHIRVIDGSFRATDHIRVRTLTAVDDDALRSVFYWISGLRSLASGRLHYESSCSRRSFGKEIAEETNRPCSRSWMTGTIKRWPIFYPSVVARSRMVVGAWGSVMAEIVNRA